MDEVTQVDPLVDLGEHITRAIGPAILSQEVAFGELTLTAEKDAIVAVATFLRDDPRCRFVSFVDVCGADYPARDERFDVVYHFMSPYLNQRVRVKVTTDDVTPVPSITGVFKGAEWFEREAYDLYGILFSGHGDLRRILQARSISEETVANMKQNLVFAFLYNAIGVPVAAGALYPVFGLLLSPMIAALAMSLSSVSVVTNALRLGRIGTSSQQSPVRPEPAHGVSCH